MERGPGPGLGWSAFIPYTFTEDSLCTRKGSRCWGSENTCILIEHKIDWEETDKT